MENLLIESRLRINDVSVKFIRSLYYDINWNSRLIAIKGSRGTGKTTLMLQYIKNELPTDHSVLYIPLDHIYFYANKLIDLVDEFVLKGGDTIFLDEIHKYPGWSREIKLIYDKYPKLKTVITSSSILEIYKGESDLSRRLVSYNLNELSLREFVELNSSIKIPAFSLDEIIINHEEIALNILKKIKPVFEYGNYIKYGAYPFFIEGVDEYRGKLLNTVNMILENDLPAVHKIDFAHIIKLKRLLFTIATSSPFKPNISELSIKTTVTRPTLTLFLNYLEKALLIYQLRNKNTGVSSMSKPDKIYLHNTNFAFQLANKNANTGTIRETFFLNQVSNGYDINYGKTADFFVENKYYFEIDGKNKKQNQIRGLENAFIVSDNIELGFNNFIPLWLFGFLY